MEPHLVTHTKKIRQAVDFIFAASRNGKSLWHGRIIGQKTKASSWI
ncbi:hypothetical protein [Rubritalea tangerina]